VVVYAIVNTDTHPWGSATTLGTLAAGLALLAAFFVIEVRFAAQPLIPMRIFRHRSLSTANGIAVTIGAAIFGMYFFLSLYLQQVDDYSPLKAGLAFFPTGLATMVAAITASRIVPHVSVRRQLVIGPTVAAAGLFWLSATTVDAGYAAHVLGPIMLVGIGLGLSFVPMTIAATAGVAPQEAGLASGLLNTARQIGGAVGLAALATLATSAASHHGPTRHDALAAVTTGYDRAYLVCGVILLIGAALAGLFLPASPRRPVETVGTPADGPLETDSHPVVVEV
jgi:predicted MFS family arabinose efflux permease